MSGETFAGIAAGTRRSVDQVLRLHGGVISYSLTTLVEQAIAVLERYLEDTAVSISEAVVSMPEYLRFGVSTPAARTLMATGVRHRRAAVLLGNHAATSDVANVLREPRDIAAEILTREDGWQEALGPFMLGRTLRDVANNAAGGDAE